MNSAPGMEACHIVPRSMYKWLPQENKTDMELWDITNSMKNSMLMSSFAHTVHKLRLLAVGPVSTSCPYHCIYFTLVTQDRSGLSVPQLLLNVIFLSFRNQKNRVP